MISGLIDDRFFFGRFNSMLNFQNLYRDFLQMFSNRVNSPERLLYLFASRFHLKIGVANSFIVIEIFKVNDEKYTLGFKSSIADQLLGKPHQKTEVVISKKERALACHNISTPYAHNRCMQNR
jgi:hypothetical protein